MGALAIVGVVLLSLAASLASEGLAWLLVYRGDDYKRKTRDLERFQAKQAANRVRAKPAKRLNKDPTDKVVADLNQSLSQMRMKSMLATAVVMIGAFQLVNSFWGGVAVARLPFEPFSLVQGITHRGLEGDDMRECSAVFIYVLASAGMRANLQKVLGTTTPKTQTPNPFGAN